jgi:1,4-dihydroxy-2-naphthoate polyprenyltransferase
MSAPTHLSRPYLKSPGFWAIAFRAYAYPASIVPIITAGTYAWYAHRGEAGFGFLWADFALALLAGLLFHSACNLINDYYDYKHGVDRPGTYGGSGVIVGGQLSMREAISVAYACLGAGLLIGLYFIYHLYQLYGQGPALAMLAVGVVGALGAVYYTATPGSAKYHALGEPMVFVWFGVGYMVGTYLILTGSVTWAAVLVSLPASFIVTAILQANDTRDIADDRESGIKTASILLGALGARVFLAVLLFAPYPVLLALCALRIVPWTALLALLTLPLALKLNALFMRVRDEKNELLKDTPPEAAKLHLAFGALMSLGILLGGWLLR